MTLHCIFHRQALCGKTLDLSYVIWSSYINSTFYSLEYTKSSPVSRFFERNRNRVPRYITAVRWLSRGKVLTRFFELRNEIEIFLIEKNKPLPPLTDCEWKLVFLVDITKHLNDFNLKLQGRDVLICDINTFVKAFS